MGSVRPARSRRNGDREQNINYGTIQAAEENTQAPRWARSVTTTFGQQLARVSGAEFLRHAPDAVIRFLLVKLLVLSWIPHPSPALLAIAVLVCVSSAIKGHSPGDMRYAGLRAILQASAFALLSIRWTSGFLNGWENNCWWFITWLPDFLRGWGDVDPVLRALLVDPAAMWLTWLWVADTWIPARVGAAMRGRTVWNGYREPGPNELPGNQRSNADLLPLIPFLFATLPTTTADWGYSFLLGLGGSFIVAYVVVVEDSDILCVIRKGVRTRSQHFAKYSDRRYVAIRAIAYGIPRLLLLVPIGVAAIFVAGKDQWLSLLPLVVVLAGCFVLYPRFFGLSWQAVEVFETYPGGQAPRPGVHDVSEIVRNPGTRLNLIKFAAYSWIPFVYGCVYHFLPGFPQFDGWAVRWPDLYLVNFVFAIVLLCVLPGQLFCGVLRACYGPMLGAFASWEEGRQVK